MKREEINREDAMDTKKKENNGLPRGWAWTTIGEITQPVEKVDPRESPQKQFTYLDISSIDNKVHKIAEPKTYYGAQAPSRARQLVRSHDVLFSTVRTYLKNIAFVSDIYDEQIASTGFAVLRAQVGISSKYLFYYSLTDNFLNSLNELQRGTSYPAVRDGDVREQSIPLAPLPEQHRIVAEIETRFTRLDAGIAALKRVQANLKRYKAAVLKAACEGKLVEQDPNDEPTSVLLERIAQNRKDAKKQKDVAPLDVDSLPALPRGWCWVTMEQLAVIIGGVTKGRDFKGKKTIRLPYLRVANVQRGFLALDEMKEIDLLEAEVEKYLLHDNDLVLTEGGDWDKLGRSAIWRNQIPNCVHQNHIFRARLYVSDMPTEWLMYCTNSEQGQAYFVEAAKQTTNLASVNLTQLRACPIPLPPVSEQHRIVAEVERRLSVAQELETTIAANLARSGRLRQAILVQAFAGKLVSQDPSDEPAEKLLERIKEGKELKESGEDDQDG